MSKRLQVVISDEDLESILRQAKIENVTVSEHVRRALREVESRRPTKSPAAKLAAIREAARCSFPTANLEEMNREIERGYQS